MLVDHLLREGMYDTANLLAESLNIKDLTNVEVKFGFIKHPAPAGIRAEALIFRFIFIVTDC